MATATPFDEVMVAPVSENSKVPGDNEEVSSRKRSLLHDIANKSAGDLTSEEKNRLYEVLMEFADVFAENSDDMVLLNIPPIQVLVARSGNSADGSHHFGENKQKR